MTDDPELPPDPARADIDDDDLLTRTITAILAADVAGFSRMVADDEEGTLRRMAEYSRIFKEAIARHRGRVFNTAGDAILAEFPSAVAALRAALEAQESHLGLNEKLAPPDQLRFRMGINVGDVVHRDGDLLGDGVNVAARLEGVAEPGGICISRSVHDAVGNKVPARIRYMGRQRLKNLATPVEVYRVRLMSDTRGENTVRSSVITAALLALVLGGGGLGWYYRDKLYDAFPALKPGQKAAVAPAPPRIALAVSVARPGQRCFKDDIRITGQFVPHREVEIRPDLDGVRVMRVLAKPLDRVAAGDALAEVMPISQREGAPITIRAPVAGIVGKSNAIAGMPSGSSAPALFTLIADGQMDFVADVSAEGLDKLKVGQPASINALGHTVVAGRVSLVSRQVDPVSQLGRATIGVERDPALRWGLFGRGTVQVGESCGLAVPTASVMHDGDLSFVYVAANDMVEARPVVTGSSSTSEVEIRSGLTATDQVIQRAGPFVREGDRIAPIAVTAGAAEAQ